MIEVGLRDVRRIALRAAGLLGTSPTPAQAARSSQQRQAAIVGEMLHSLGSVQLDTISVLARSHELIAYSRFGALRRAAIEQAYWSGSDAFEYWSHAACILPMRSWPLFSFRRRHYLRKGERWHGRPKRDLDALLATIRDRGPITTSEVGGAKRGGEWWDWSDSKIGLEWLLDIGTVVVTRRVGWRRTYDLAERAVPAELLHEDLDDEQCMVELVAQGARLMGIGTAGDIADVHRLPKAAVARHAEAAGLLEVRVPGWPRAWADPSALEPGSGRHRTTMLSPFDPLIWHRERVERLFGMRHRLEAYTPAPKRVHGYFAMPVLHGGKLVARVDPRRERNLLIAATVTFESAAGDRVPEPAIEGTAAALVEAAGWVGCEGIRIGTVVPRAAGTALRAAIGGRA